MKQVQFSGTGVALVTPFKNGKIDWPALEQIIEHCIAGGVEYLVSLGTTGEAVTLSSQECRQILDFTIQVADGRLPIVAGLFGGNDTKTLANKIKNYNFKGIDAILSSSPAYSKPTQEGIFQHYMALAQASSRPIIIYNVPGRTSSNVTAETTLRLAKASDKFVAIKEASADMVQAMKILKRKNPDFLLLSGDDPTALPLITCGGQGVISVIANAYPQVFSDMVRAALEGKLEKARGLNNKLLDIHHWLYIDGNPCGIKAAMEVLGLCSREVRLPLVPMSESNFDRLQQEMMKAGKSQTVSS